MTKVLIGIDLGGTNIKIGCFDTRLSLIRKVSDEPKTQIRILQFTVSLKKENEREEN